MLHPSKQVTFSDFSVLPSCQSLIFQFSWPACWPNNHPGASHFSLQNIPHLLGLENPPYTVPLVHAWGRWSLCACKSLHKQLAVFLRALFLKCRLVSWLRASGWAAQRPLHASLHPQCSQVLLLLLHCCPGQLLRSAQGCLLSCLALLCSTVALFY